MDIVKKSVKQTERIKKQASAGFKTDLALEESAVKRIIAPSVKLTRVNVQKSASGVTVSAVARINVLYEGESSLDVYESGVDFSMEIPFDGEYLREPLIFVSAGAVNIAMNAGGYSLTAEVFAEAEFLVACSFDYVCDAESAICKKTAFSALEYKLSQTGNYQTEEQKEFRFSIKKLLCACDKVRVLGVQCGQDCVFFDAEVGGDFLFLTDSGERVRESVWFPFRYELEAEGVSPDMVASGAAFLCDSSYRVESSEQDDSSVVTFLYEVAFLCDVYEKTENERVEDCFSVSNEVEISRGTILCETARELTCFKGKCLGEAVCERDGIVKEPFDAEVYGLDYSVDSGKITFSGVVKTNVLTENADGVIKRAVCELLFSLEFSLRYSHVLSAFATVKGVSVKEYDGKCVLEGEISFCAVCIDQKSEAVIENVIFGAEKPMDDCAVSMVFIKKGDDAWDVCKKAGVSERLLKQQNPSVSFPAENDGVISVYRKIDL